MIDEASWTFLKHLAKRSDDCAVIAQLTSDRIVRQSLTLIELEAQHSQGI